MKNVLYCLTNSSLVFQKNSLKFWGFFCSYVQKQWATGIACSRCAFGTSPQYQRCHLPYGFLKGCTAIRVLCNHHKPVPCQASATQTAFACHPHEERGLKQCGQNLPTLFQQFNQESPDFSRGEYAKDGCGGLGLQ